MDPALSIVDKALKGDTGALSFLEQTVSIYIYDCTNPSHPKICGAWDFLNQAFSEVERYDNRVVNARQHGQHGVFLDAHVQMLATMSRKAARRSPTDDQAMVRVCLSNALHFQKNGSNEYANQLITSNQQMRDRFMGRIATITFDFSNHPQNANAITSSFSNPIAMDSLCAVVAANAIATGPHEVSSLIEEWIIPSRSNMPPFSVASVICHLAAEATGKYAPSGTMDTVKRLFESLISNVIVIMLAESVGNSDHSESGVGGNHRTTSQRIAAMTIRALDKWCSATICSISNLKKICQKVKVNVIDVISDALYSDSDIVLDALSELLDTLLRNNDQGDDTAAAFAIGAAIPGLSEMMGGGLMEEISNDSKARDEIIIELVAAIGMQRFRFADRQAQGDDDVCRYLTAMARSISSASQRLVRTNDLGTFNGLITLLTKATTHSSLHVYSLALEGFKFLMHPSNDLATKILPVLQSKVIIPLSLVDADSASDVDLDFDEFERFREFHLAEILSICYTNCRSYYINSCAVALQEFCSPTSAPHPHTALQLEAVLFCLSTVAFEASKRALLTYGTNRAFEVAAKAASSQQQGVVHIDVNALRTDAKSHDDLLAKCTIALSNCQGLIGSSNPLLLSQLCRFLGLYAKWFSSTKIDGILDMAARMTLVSFNDTASRFGQNSDLLDQMGAHPFSQASTALRNILSRAPQKFTNAEAMIALETAWRGIYSDSSHENKVISLNDKKALGSGITRVLGVHPQEQWASSLPTLSTPIVERIKVLVEAVSQQTQDISKLDDNLKNMSDEICVLATVIRSFYTVAKKQPNTTLGIVKAPLLNILERVWPFIKHISQNLSTKETVVSSLSEFLLIVTSLNDGTQDIVILKEACEIAVAIIDTASQQQKVNMNPILEFIEDMIQTFGHLSEVHALSFISSSTSSDTNQQLFSIIDTLLQKSFQISQSNLNGIENDALSGFFQVCKSCVFHCPALFLQSTAPTDSAKHICLVSVTAAKSTLTSRRVDIVRSAALYLNEIFLLITANLSNASETQSSRSLVAPKFVELIAPLKDELLITIMQGVCGNFPREVLDPIGTLLFSMLKVLSPSELQESGKKMLNIDAFSLGDSSKQTVMAVFTKGSEAVIPASTIMDLLDDIWTLHQNESGGSSIAGGDQIVSFNSKYSK